MTSDSKIQLPSDLEDETRDVADLWKDALKAYKGIVGFDLEKKFDNVQAMIDQGTKEMNNFHSFRHNDKKVDKLRSLFANNLDYIEKGAQQLISAATPAFPPAAAIGTAITFMLGRIVILETRLPGHKAYQNCLMDVFTSFLTTCGYAHKYIELGRFKKWISNLLQGGDSDLSGARKTMDVKLTRLQNATEFAILGNTEDLKKMNSELQQNSDIHTAMLQDQKEVMSSIHETTETIRNDMAKLLKAFDSQKKESSAKSKAKPSNFKNNKSDSANRVRNLFIEIEGEDHEYYVLKDTIIPDTCNWVFDEPQWEEWHTHEDPSPVLAISGDPGVGKSHIGASVYDKLLKEAEDDSSKHLCAAHFYFREQATDLHTFIKAIEIVIIQVVEQNDQVCEMVLAEYNKDDVSIDWDDSGDLFSKLLGPVFRKDSDFRLNIMLDGIDELSDFENLLKILEIIQRDELRISVVVTTRPERVKEISDVVPTISILVEKEKQKLDLRGLIWNRLNSLSALRTFGRYVKQRVADKLEDASPSKCSVWEHNCIANWSDMLYAENMLLRFNSLGREAAALRCLEKPLPADLDEVYKILVAECYRHLIPEHKSLVNRLLLWVANKTSLSLDEVNSLLRLWTGDNKFDVDEIPDSLLNLIRIGDPGADAEKRARIRAQGGWATTIEQLDKSEDNPDSVYNDGNLPVKFHERSMRAYICNSRNQDGSRRPTPSETYRQMFLDLANILRLEKDSITIALSLREYTFERVFHYWRDIEPESHSVEEQAQVMEVFGNIMLDKYHFSERYINQEGDKWCYCEMFNDKSFEKVSTWASLLESNKQFLSEDVAHWWAGLKDNPRDCLLQLLKAHTKILYRTEDYQEALKRFIPIDCIAKLRPMDDKITERLTHNFKDHEENADASDKLVMALEGLFDDIPMDTSSYRAVAEVLLCYAKYEQASETCQKALDMSDDVLETLKSQALMAQIWATKDPTKAYTYAMMSTESLNQNAISPKFKREAYSTRARIERELEKKDEAARSFAQARKSDLTELTPGFTLNEEISLFSSHQDSHRVVETLKDWSPLERLTYMAHDYQDSGKLLHSRIRDAAWQTNEEQFVIDVYEDCIKHLNNVKAAAPLQCELALLHWQVRKDLDTARKILDQVLEGGSNLWAYAVTSASPYDILGRAVVYQSDIAWELFQESSDPDVKAELLDSIRTILTRPLALDVPPNTSNFHRPLTLARMYFKMGPLVECQKILQDVVNSCHDHLNDTVDWNDSHNLVFLARVLYMLSKKVRDGGQLIRVARILLSAQLSCLDPKLSQESDNESSEAGPDTPTNESDETEDSNEAPAPAEEPTDETLPDEGDLRTDKLQCKGECNPSKEFGRWGNQVAYQCMVCFEGFLCQECHENRVAVSKDDSLKLLVSCGKNHECLKMPIEGWHGVKDGNVLMEGEEPLDFKELLRQIRDEICKQVWEELWQG
ncbi:nacht and tpr domain-containing [Fusarium longipes]|uniref:Nacht and tpr domain-containing n=1 Tax=Fusarium longipes TaxID=694270 RepID=A0A395TAS3_9HYPO|nr:nacht and tpr domain-containing [Fusarium longipes]